IDGREPDEQRANANEFCSAFERAADGSGRTNGFIFERRDSVEKQRKSSLCENSRSGASESRVAGGKNDDSSGASRLSHRNRLLQGRSFPTMPLMVLPSARPAALV